MRRIITNSNDWEFDYIVILATFDELGLTFFWSMIFPEDDVDATRPPLKNGRFLEYIYINLDE